MEIAETTFSTGSLCSSCRHCKQDFSVDAIWCELECDSRWNIPNDYYEDCAVKECWYYKEDSE